MTDDKLGVISPGLPFVHASANLSFVICHLSFAAALFYCGSLHGACIPSSTPAPAAVAAARSEINAFERFLREPLCEQIAVKYQLATDYASIGEVG